MMRPANRLPLLVDPDQLETVLDEPDIRIVDLCREETFDKLHVPGAVHLSYQQLLAPDPPINGLPPDDHRIEQLLSELGIAENTHVVAYDEEGGGWASRLLWTLELVGHTQWSLLDGGIYAWANEGHPVTRQHSHPPHTDYRVGHRNSLVLADAPWILEHLDHPETAILDVRSPAEYQGHVRHAMRAGRIPGAVNFEWTEAMDREQNLRMRPAPELQAKLHEIGLAVDKEIVVYCQSHHRSAYGWVMLKVLDYPRVRGYAGSWSEWGNREDTPVETG